MKQADGFLIQGHSSLTRRAFLGWIGQAALWVGLGSVLYVSAINRDFLRPPGSVPEKRFLASCIKCQKCLEVCPTGVVVPVSVAANIVASGTPMLNFRLGECTLCMKCIDVCPTGALRPVRKESVKLGMAQIDKEKCIAWNWANCTKCHTECPIDAIGLDEAQRPQVKENCNGCGRCEYICPAPSFRAYRGSGKGVVIVPIHVVG